MQTTNVSKKRKLKRGDAVSISTDLITRELAQGARHGNKKYCRKRCRRRKDLEALEISPLAIGVKYMNIQFKMLMQQGTPQRKNLLSRIYRR